MTDIRFYYVTEQQLAEISHPSPERTTELHSIAERRWLSRAARPKRGMLDQLGPLTKNPLLPQNDFGVPIPADVTALLAGNNLEPARRLAGWRLIDTWLSSTASSSSRITSSQSAWESFAQATQIPTFLTNEPLPFQLSLLPMMRAGYTTYADAIRCSMMLTAAKSHLAIQHLGLADQLLNVLPANDNGDEKAAFAYHLAPIIVTLIFP